jgi:hypothetical protein
VKSGGIEVDCQNSLVEMKIVDPNNLINLLLKGPLKVWDPNLFRRRLRRRRRCCCCCCCCCCRRYNFEIFDSRDLIIQQMLRNSTRVI